MNTLMFKWNKAKPNLFNERLHTSLAPTFLFASVMQTLVVGKNIHDVDHILSTVFGCWADYNLRRTCSAERKTLGFLHFGKCQNIMNEMECRKREWINQNTFAMAAATTATATICLIHLTLESKGGRWFICSEIPYQYRIASNLLQMGTEIWRRRGEMRHTYDRHIKRPCAFDLMNIKLTQCQVRIE